MWEASTDWGQKYSKWGKSAERHHLNWVLKVRRGKQREGPGVGNHRSVGSVRLKKGEQWAEGEARQACLGSLRRPYLLDYPFL